MSLVTKIIQPKFSLAVLSTYDKIKQEIVNEIIKVKHLVISPTMIEFVHYISTLIENIVVKKDNINKATLFVDIIKSIFPNVTEDEISICKSIVNYLLDSNQIKKIPLLKYVTYLARELIGTFLKLKEKKKD
jgi:hypothetical protein